LICFARLLEEILNHRVADSNLEVHEDVSIPPDAFNELNVLVTSIASLYKMNTFHNFEHSCHATTSTLKVLDKIKEHTAATHDDPFESLDNTDLCQAFSDPLTRFAIVFAALSSVTEHCGATQAPRRDLLSDSCTGRSVWALLMECQFAISHGCFSRHYSRGSVVANCGKKCRHGYGHRRIQSML
jgi:hypothetical protein